MFHLHIRYRSRDGGGSCESARQYIVREGCFAKRGDEVLWVHSMHMPEWAGGSSAGDYWRAAEGPFSRANARSALLIEFALPRELSLDAQKSLAMAFAEGVSGMGLEDASLSDRLPVTMALHSGYGRNPHIHMLVSTSINDGERRPFQRWFKRFLPKSPADGGAPRSRFITKRKWVYKVRTLWASLANKVLLAAGKEPTLDHRSHAERGIEQKPTVHLGPRIAPVDAKGIPTIRGRRNEQVQQEKLKSQEEIDTAIAAHRKAIQRLVMEEQCLQESIDKWSRASEEIWRGILQNHPLAGDGASRLAAMRAMVFESDSSEANGLRTKATFEAIRSAKTFIDAAGPAWEAVTTDDGFWAVRPNADGVVHLSHGVAATDADDSEAIDAMLQTSQLLQFKSPYVKTHPGLAEQVQRSLDRLGLNWPLHIAKDRRHKPEPTI